MIVIIINNHRAHILLLHYNFIANDSSVVTFTNEMRDVCVCVRVCARSHVRRFFLLLSHSHLSSIVYSRLHWHFGQRGFCFISILLTVSWIVGNKNRTALHQELQPTAISAVCKWICSVRFCNARNTYRLTSGWQEIKKSMSFTFSSISLSLSPISSIFFAYVCNQQWEFQCLRSLCAFSMLEFTF